MDEVNNKSTGLLLTELMSSPNLEQFFSHNSDAFSGPAPGEAISALIESSGLSKAELARRAGTSDVYLYQVTSGMRSPSREKVLAICISTKASLEDIQAILKKCSLAELYPKNRRDAIIIKGITSGKTVKEINAYLLKEGEKGL